MDKKNEAVRPIPAGEIAKRATTALMMFDNSKHNEISNEDLAIKVNEALRLIKALADNTNHGQ